uniref:Uncharacterized protein n=1 Tax=Cacopsylla melanoneura TaxID=428564 RepID=A0A8D8LH84_9HEMI
MGVLEFKSPPIRIYIIIYYPGSAPGILVVSCIRYKFHFFPIGTYTIKKEKRLVVHWKRELEKIFYHGEIALQGTSCDGVPGFVLFSFLCLRNFVRSSSPIILVYFVVLSFLSIFSLIMSETELY